MKKTLLRIMLGLTLAFALCASALAQTTGIAVDGKTFIWSRAFCGCTTRTAG